MVYILCPFHVMKSYSMHPCPFLSADNKVRYQKTLLATYILDEFGGIRLKSHCGFSKFA